MGLPRLQILDDEELLAVAVLFDRKTAEAQVLLAQKGDRAAYEQVGKLILKMINAAMGMSEFIKWGKSAKQEMRDEAVTFCLKNVGKWDPARGSTFYSFMMMIIKQSFRRAGAKYMTRYNAMITAPLSRLGEFQLIEEAYFHFRNSPMK